ATLLNYAEVTEIRKDAEGYVDGVTAREVETGEEFHALAKVVINATGAFSDRLRRIAEPDAAPMIAPSQGIHLVFDGAFLAGESAIMVPHTRDGRVLFAIPWHGHTLVGTTDTAIPAATLEPVAMDEEIDFILSTAGQYLARAPRRDDVLSVFAGVRPLVRTAKASTAELSRDHVIHIDRSGLISVMGGKWTTYRHMAEDCVDQAATFAELPERPCVTQDLRIHGFHAGAKEFGSLSVYGSDALHIRKLIETDVSLGGRLHPALPYVNAEVVWAVRQEMARTVEDVLARRTRALFLNAAAALEMAPVVADVMACELGWGEAAKAAQLAAFREIAKNYTLRAPG
ncbi:MAG: FAD-dependent oxidoreductase, partial [Terriglobales bacterium]